MGESKMGQKISFDLQGWVRGDCFENSSKGPFGKTSGQRIVTRSGTM